MCGGGRHVKRHAKVEKRHAGVMRTSQFLALTATGRFSHVCRERFWADGAPLNGAANRTYSVLYKNSLTEPAWTKSHDLPSRPTNYTAIINNSLPPADHRFFKVVTPALP